MASKFVKPSKEEKRLKAMFYGPAGVGKTTAAIQFPRPALIDTEKGAVNDAYVDQLNKVGGVVMQTSDFGEMLDAVTGLVKDPGDIQTVIIDPITVVYNDLLAKAERKVGSEFGRHYGEADKHMKHLVNLLPRIDTNVIITCHAKNVYGDGMKIEGRTFDGYKKLDYLFDLVFEIDKRGQQRVGIVKKSRVAGFTDGEVFPFSYDTIADRYGRAIIERAGVGEVLATPEQVAEMERLTKLLKLPDETVDKWLDKAKAESFAEMPSDAAAKCIAFMLQQVGGAK
jgi:hypothetical protein